MIADWEFHLLADSTAHLESYLWDSRVPPTLDEWAAAFKELKAKETQQHVQANYADYSRQLQQAQQSQAQQCLLQQLGLRDEQHRQTGVPLSNGTIEWVTDLQQAVMGNKKKKYHGWPPGK